MAYLLRFTQESPCIIGIMLGRRKLADLSEAIREAPSYVNAWRYALDHDGLRFIVQTLKELPPEPPPEGGLLVFFAHYDPQDLVDEYVRYYLEKLHALGAVILFVSGSPEMKLDAAKTIAPYCAGIYTRRTLALDFGSWHLAWCICRSRGWRLSQFRQLLLANDSVYGPLFDLGEMLPGLTGADMYGVTENREIAPHLQSYFLLWDLNDRTLAFLNTFWTNFRYIVDKEKLVARCEVGLSELARAKGLKMKAYISAETAQQVVRQNPTRQYSNLLLEGDSSYIVYLWDGLIEQLRFPFLKTALVRRNPWRSQTIADWRSLLERTTSYPTELIENNLRRLNAGPGRSWT